MIYFLLLPGVCSALRQYYFVDKSLSWGEAQSHCRQYGGELATVRGPEDQERLVELGRKHNSNLWIGLYDDVKSWTWSLSENANYRGGEVEPWSWPWRRNKPIHPRDSEGCVKTMHGTWRVADCNMTHFFFCFDNTRNEARLSGSSIVFIDILKSWWDAQSYCRENHTDLLNIRNLEENSLVKQSHLLERGKWIGLHRNVWSTWSDGSNSSYRNWKDPPMYPAWTENNCTLALSNSGWQWADQQCNSKFKFLCNVVPGMKRSFRIKLSSADLDPNDPELSKAILKQLHGKLKEKMVNKDFSLTWTKAPDGEIFHNTRKDEKTTS